MADFRKLFYALAVVTLLAGLTVPAVAQPTMTCTANAGVPPLVRSEGFAELVGDLILLCTGGTPTPNGQVVPPVNFTVFLTTNITSNPLSGIFNEALLIMDEPNSPVNPTRPLLNCGKTGAPDTGPSGPGVCSITATPFPALTYDGTPQGYADGADDGTDPDVCGSTPGAPAADTYGCGRPNVFQGRQGVPQNQGQANAVSFLGVPLDPPGEGQFRTIRITNIRADAELLGVSATFNTTPIVMNISVSGSTSLAINNPSQTVAFIQRGLQAIQVNPIFDYIQCLPEELPSLSGISGSAYSLSILPTNRRMYIRFREGFANAWKTKGWEQMEANGDLPGVGQQYRFYDVVDAPTNYPGTVVRQNVPNAIYNTESGFNNPPDSFPAKQPADQNPPIGVGTVPVTAAISPFTDNYGANEGISGAGVANQGTRLVLSFQPNTIPLGSTVWVPSVVFLTRDGTNAVTGVAVRTVTANNGSGAYTRFSTGGSTTWTSIGSDLIAVYEILFTDPFALESLTVPVGVSYTPNLSQNRPDPTVTARVGGGFAPFYDPGPTPRAPSSSLPEPRFIPGQTPQDLFRINKCACNLLFPFVTNAAAGGSAFDTGIALANTSLDPGINPYGFTAVPQEGSVRFFYYNTAPPPGGAAAPLPQCTNAADPGGQNGTVCNTKVPAGAVLTYVLSKGSQQWGLDPRAAGFTGYMIAQADFQYCHAFAYISAQDAGPTTPGMSVGYLALVLDKGFELQRTLQTLSDTLGH